MPETGNNRLGRQDGSIGAWQAKAVTLYGWIYSDMPGVPPYSGQVARKYGNRPGPPAEWIADGKTRLVAGTAMVTSLREAKLALDNGYPVTIASNAGFTMSPDRDGFHRRKGRWPHQMCLTFYDEGAGTGKPACFGILNSWGDAMGRVTDFRTGENWPIGMLRVTEDAVEEILSQEDSFAFSGMNGGEFVRRELTRADFDVFRG